MDDKLDTGLPASIEAAWGIRERPGKKGPRRGLTLQRIIRAAVRIAEAEGIAAVSMSRVAADLGAGVMSLYRYVAAKDELLALMVDAVHGVPPEPVPGEGWREGLSRWSWGQHEALRGHPWVLHASIGDPPTTPNQIAWLEVGLACLDHTGLDEATQLSVILLVSGFVRSDASLTTEFNAHSQATGATSPQAMAAYGRLLAKIIRPEDFPALHRVIKAGVFDRPDDPDAEFIFGLERVLDGIEKLIKSKR